MEAYRPGTIYVSKKTLRRLKWLRDAGLAGIKKNAEDSPTERLHPTLDSIAEQFLNEYIEDKFPDVLKVEALMSKAEKEALETLKNK